jgi:nitroimidazol reductase NimA-like FMN-containing flavoprotein (pyridoxamine 5'-phosphate oxidase superfamily)
MRLVPKLEIRSRTNLIEFLNAQPVGRIASIDERGYPQIIPMNFVHVESRTSSTEVFPNGEDIPHADFGTIYMHSHPSGEKIENVRRNSKVGFEVDLPICFLPSYYFHPTDASQADTLYISVVIKGNASIVIGLKEKTLALNALMNKYQKEGGYQPVSTDMPTVREVTVIRVVPIRMSGKYKIGQHWSPNYRIKIARAIIKREGITKANTILKTMGIELLNDGSPHIIFEPLM